MRYLNYNEIAVLLNKSSIDLSYKDEVFNSLSMTDIVELDFKLTDDLFDKQYANVIDGSLNLNEFRELKLHYFKSNNFIHKLFKRDAITLKKGDIVSVQVRENIVIEDSSLMATIFPSNDFIGKFICLKTFIHKYEIVSALDNILIQCTSDTPVVISENDNIFNLKFFF